MLIILRRRNSARQTEGLRKIADAEMRFVS